MVTEFWERNLPHWFPAGAAVMLTAQLAGSLPAPLIAQLRAEYSAARARLAPDDDAALLALKSRQFARIEYWLDQVLPETPRWLAEPGVATLVLDSLHWLVNRGDFVLLGACVMPNHLHFIIRLPPELTRRADQTLRDFKQFTAVHANRLLGRRGQFWQHETFDHVIRKSAAGGVHRALRYVLYNPVKANLCSEWAAWPGTWCHPDWVAEM